MFERGEKAVKVNDYFVVDFDRVLGNTPNLFKLLLDTTQASGNDLIAGQLKQAYEEASASATSLSVAKFLNDRLESPDFLSQIQEDFLRRSSESEGELTMEGAEDFLQYLSSKEAPHGILSYGDPMWQKMKIAAAGFESVPNMIVDTKHKAKVAMEWFDGSEFHIPRQMTPAGQAIKATNIVVVDDKIDAFTDMGVQMRGYWVNSISNHPVEVEKVAKMEYGERLVATRNLTGVIAVEESFRRNFSQAVVLTQ